MRTTLDIDDRVLAAARELAASERKSLGEVVSALAARGLRPDPAALGEEDGLPVFAVPADAAPLTLDLVQRALDDAS
jgi:hypothetical protein